MAPEDAVTTSYENEHVHEVYEQIAGHFSQTRHKPWPVVNDFLKSLRPGSIGLDVGCGNGKYLTVNKDIFIVASDRSPSLVNIARQHQPHSALVADTLNLPHANETFDFAISIAVLHHLATEPRRIEAITSILRTLKPVSGQALIFVWALEQRNSRRGWDAGDQQDVLVPWVTKQGVAQGGEPVQEKTYQRYYHLSQAGELERLVDAAGGSVIRAGYDRDNWWVVAARES
jgi:tRNA (uracil-5-)-methyltransferase TRM9